MVQFRKSKSVGGLRATVTKRGVSLSGGPKGARVSANSRGEVHRTLSIPGTGLSDRKKISGGKKPSAGVSPGETKIRTEVIDLVGDDYALFGSPDIEEYAVVGLRDAGVTAVEVAERGGITKGESGFVRGIRGAALVDQGTSIGVMVMVTPEQNPKLFDRKQKKAGTPQGFMAGRLGKKDAEKLRPELDFGEGGMVAVGVYVDATPGLDGRLEVRFRRSLLDLSKLPPPPAR